MKLTRQTRNIATHPYVQNTGVSHYKSSHDINPNILQVNSHRIRTAHLWFYYYWSVTPWTEYFLLWPPSSFFFKMKSFKDLTSNILFQHETYQACSLNSAAIYYMSTGSRTLWQMQSKANGKKKKTKFWILSSLQFLHSLLAHGLSCHSPGWYHKEGPLCSRVGGNRYSSFSMKLSLRVVWEKFQCDFFLRSSIASLYAN